MSETRVTVRDARPRLRWDRAKVTVCVEVGRRRERISCDGPCASAAQCRAKVRGYARAMDYQCVVVYTVINIAPPRLTTQAAELNGCIAWFKNKLKRLV